jgi:hypothetical protein
MASFAPVISRPDKRIAGRTGVRKTALSIRGNVGTDAAARRRIREKLGRALAPMATRIERVSVRFDDVNGPRGGVDTRCRARVILSGLDSVVVEQRGRTPEHAVRLATPRLRRALQDKVKRQGGKTPPPTATGANATTRTRAAAPPDARSPRRTVKRRTQGMTATLEEPAERPSRKTTRGSVNRAKAGSPVGRATKRRKFSPTKRNTRGK